MMPAPASAAQLSARILRVLKISLPTQQAKDDYERALVLWAKSRGFGINALVKTGFPGGKERIRELAEVPTL